MLKQAISGSMVLQGGANFVPFLRSLLGLGGGIGLADAVIIMAGADVPLMLNESAKKGRRNASDLLSRTVLTRFIWLRGPCSSIPERRACSVIAKISGHSTSRSTQPPTTLANTDCAVKSQL